MSKDELIYKVLSLENFKNDINSKPLDLNDCFSNFDGKYKMVNCNLSISRRCNEFLLGWFTQFERNSVNNTLCNRRETLEINPVLFHIVHNSLEQSVWQSLTGISVEPADLKVCHGMKKNDRVIVHFICRKQKHLVFSNCKNVQN